LPYSFYLTSKKIEREHIEQQMHVIGMKETIGKQPIALSLTNSRRIKNQLVHQLSVSECRNRNKNGYDDNK
jgi:hypothetical protein